MRHAELHRIFHGFKRPAPLLTYSEDGMQRRHSDRVPGSTSAGWKYQVSHWLAWIAAIAQALANAFGG